MDFWGILGPPYCGIGATIRIGQETLCLPYAGFLIKINQLNLNQTYCCVAFMLLSFFDF